MEKQETFFGLLVRFAAPLLAVVMMMLASGFFITFISIHLNDMGVSSTKIGIIQSAYYAGMFFGAFKMEEVIRSVGHVQSLAAFGSIAMISILTMALSSNFYLWVFMRFLGGVSLAAVYIVIESWMLNNSNIKQRGIIIAVYMIFLYGSQGLSQQFLAFLDLKSYVPYVVSALFTAGAIIAVSFSTNRLMICAAEDSVSFKDILKAGPFGVVGCLASGLILSALYSFYPIYAENIGFSVQNMMTIMIFGGVLLQWPFGKISDILDRRIVLLGLIVLAILVVLANYFYSGTSWWQIYILTFFIGGVSFTLYPICVTQVCDNLDPHHITKIASILLVAYGVGSLSGPMLCSNVVTFFGIHSMLLYITAILVLLFIFGLTTLIWKTKVPMDEQNEFVALPRMTPVAYEMDPRSDDEEEK